jgi:hypothetical protein
MAAPANGMGCWPFNNKDPDWDLESGQRRSQESTDLLESAMHNYLQFKGPTWEPPPNAKVEGNIPPNEKLPPMLQTDFVALTENKENQGGYSRKGTSSMQIIQRV